MRDCPNRDLYEAIDAMQVGDCLQWEVERGRSKRAILSGVSCHFARRKPGDKIIRALAYCDRLFFVRLA